MKGHKLLRSFLIVGVVLASGIEIGEILPFSQGQNMVSTVEARVGRPLTPVSVAGVARRTVRRCAAGIYNCSYSGALVEDTLVAAYHPVNTQVAGRVQM